MLDVLENIEVYCINLSDRLDRKKYISQHFSDLRINNYKFVKAFYPKDMDDSYLKECLKYGMEPGEAACGYSSLISIKKFLDESDKEYLLVCEDDVDLSNILKIQFKLTDIFALFDINVECIQLAVSTRQDIQFNPNIRLRSPWDFNTTCYMLTKDYAQKVVSKYFNDKITLNNFNSVNIFDYRNKSFIKSSPVAEYVVYNTTNAVTVPIFTYSIFNSSVNQSDERLEQSIKSRNDFYCYWNNFQTIKITDLVGL